MKVVKDCLREAHLGFPDLSRFVDCPSNLLSKVESLAQNVKNSTIELIFPPVNPI